MGGGNKSRTFVSGFEHIRYYFVLPLWKAEEALLPHRMVIQLYLQCHRFTLGPYHFQRS